MEESEEIKKGIVERLREEGILNRNTGTHSIKSLKEVISKETNPILIQIRDSLISMASSISDQTEAIKDRNETEKEKNKDDKRNERLRPKDSDSGLIKEFKLTYKLVSDKLDGISKTFKDSVSKIKDFGSDAGGFLKKALAVATIGLILKDVIDEWTGGAVTEFIESLSGENGLIRQIGSTALALGALGLLIAPTSTITLGFMALKGLVKTGGVLLNGLGAMRTLLRPEGGLLRGLGDLAGAFGSGGRRGSGGRGLLGSIGRLTSSFGGMLGKLAGRAGLVALIGAVAAGFTGLMSLIPGRTPNVPTPRVTDIPNEVDPSIKQAMRRQEEARVRAAADAERARTAPAPDVDTTSPEAPRAPTADAPPRPAAIVDTPTASADTSSRIIPPVADMPVDPTASAKVISPARKAAIVAKAVGKAGLKAIPILGMFLGAGLTAVRAYMGDTEGAMIEGAATFAPSLVGLPADIALAVHDVINDMYYESYGVYPFNDTEENRSARLPGIREEAISMVHDALKDNNTSATPDTSYEDALAMSSIPMEMPEPAETSAPATAPSPSIVPDTIQDTPDAALVPDVTMPAAESAATIMPTTPPPLTSEEIVRAVRNVENDLYNEAYGLYPSEDTEENRLARLPEIRKEAVAMVIKTLPQMRQDMMNDEDAAMMAPVRILSDAELSTINDPNSPNYEYAAAMGINGMEALQNRYAGQAMAQSSVNQIRVENAARYERGATSAGEMGEGSRGNNFVAPTNINKGGDTYSNVTNNYYTSTSTSRSIDPSLPMPIAIAP